MKRCGLYGKETEDHNKRTSQEKRQYGLNTRKLKCNDKIKIHTGERTELNQ